MMRISSLTSRTSAGASFRFAGSKVSRPGLTSTRRAPRPFRVGQQRLEAAEVPLVHDARVVVILCERRIQDADRMAHRAGEVFDALARDERIVRRDARLPGIEQLAEGDLRRDRFERALHVDDHRRLAAELERDRCQIFRRRLRDDAADGSRSREKQVIERQLGERLADRRVAGKHRHFVLGKRFAHDARHQGSRPGRELGRLDHHAIARGQRAQRGQHRQLVGIVPRGDDANDAERLRDEPVEAGTIFDVGRDPARLHPVPADSGGHSALPRRLPEGLRSASRAASGVRSPRSPCP
jgi:hypothetical protein